MWQPVKFQLDSRIWTRKKQNEMIFYRIYELMLATLIQRYDKESMYLTNERLTEILQAVRCPHLMIVLIQYIC